jgi:hypothetical protein
MKRYFLAGAAALLASSAALADVTFAIPLSGTMTYSADICDHPDGSTDGCSITTPFTGPLEVVLPSAADGFYFAPGITMFLGSPAYSITSSSDYQFGVTVLGGRITDIYADAAVGSGYMAVNMGGPTGLHLEDGDVHGYTVIDAALIVPEPSAAGLVLAGVGLLATRSRRRAGYGKTVAGTASD